MPFDSRLLDSTRVDELLVTLEVFALPGLDTGWEGTSSRTMVSDALLQCSKENEMLLPRNLQPPLPSQLRIAVGALAQRRNRRPPS